MREGSWRDNDKKKNISCCQEIHTNNKGDENCLVKANKGDATQITKELANVSGSVGQGEWSIRIKHLRANGRRSLSAAPPDLLTLVLTTIVHSLCAFVFAVLLTLYIKIQLNAI